MQYFSHSSMGTFSYWGAEKMCVFQLKTGYISEMVKDIRLLRLLLITNRKSDMRCHIRWKYWPWM